MTLEFKVTRRSRRKLHVLARKLGQVCVECSHYGTVLYDEPDGEGCLLWDATMPEDGFCHMWERRREA